MNEQDKLMMELSKNVSYIKAVLDSEMNGLKRDIMEIKNTQVKESERNSEKLSKIFEVESRLAMVESELKQQKDKSIWRERIIVGAVITMAITAFVWLLTGQKF